MDDTFNLVLARTTCHYDPALKLKPLQHECLHHIFMGKDVIANLPTGYGKSIIFHLLPGTVYNSTV